jgi:hypothetical protein
MKPNAERIQEIFALALEKKSPAERERYLAEACQGNLELRQQVQSLLLAHEQAGEFLGQTVKPPPSNLVTERAGTMIGRYKLLELIGEGGFGTVWMAEQEEPVRRRVALKVIKPGMDTRQVLARFEAERQALAMMDHPSIARVFDGGATDTGRPYFVMELVRGTRITDYCDANKLSTRERLLLFIQVCQAVQHAHQKGIIHRDLKPSNILVTEVDGAPVPKVIDFGVAKATQSRLTDLTLFTGLHQMIGTPSYMSPEQAGLGALDMDTRSDIYVLGVLLYELLTGQTPLTKEESEKAGLDEIFRLIREQDPPKPSTRLSALTREELTTIAARRQAEPVKLNRLLTGDLDWIVMKALEKNRGRRYESAGSLAMDIQRHLQNEPVTACPPGNWYRFRKMARRNKVAFISAGAVVAALCIGFGLSTWLYLREKAARKEVEAARLNETRLRQKNLAAEKALHSETQQLLQAVRLMHSDPNNKSELDQAGTFFRQTLQLQKNELGKDSQDVAATLFDLANVMARTGRYQEAADDLKPVVEAYPSNEGLWLLLMPLLIESGNIADYQTHCKAMLDRFGNTTNSTTAERTAKSCLLLPSAVGPDDLKLVASLAANAVALGKDHPGTWQLMTKGLAEYRQGHFTGAVENMQLSRKELAHGSHWGPDICEADTYLVAAMAHHQLKQPDEARADLARGLEIVQSKLPGLDSGDLGISWHDVLTTYILMREAKETVEGTPAAGQK